MFIMTMAVGGLDGAADMALDVFIHVLGSADTDPPCPCRARRTQESISVLKTRLSSSRFQLCFQPCRISGFSQPKRHLVKTGVVKVLTVVIIKTGGVPRIFQQNRHTSNGCGALQRLHLFPFRRFLNYVFLISLPLRRFLPPSYSTLSLTAARTDLDGGSGWPGSRSRGAWGPCQRRGHR